VKITPELMRAHNSGTDPNDASCMKGYDVFLKAATEYDPNNPHLPNLAALNRVLSDNYRDGVFTDHEYKEFRVWCINLRKSAKAVQMGGGKTTDVYRAMIAHKEVTGSLDEVSQAVEEHIQGLKRFDLVNVLKHRKTKKGTQTMPVKNVNQITEGFQYSVLQRDIGRFTPLLDPADALSAVQAEFDRAVQRERGRCRIQVLVRDEAEGIEAWQTM